MKGFGRLFLLAAPTISMAAVAGAIEAQHGSPGALRAVAGTLMLLAPPCGLMMLPLLPVSGHERVSLLFTLLMYGAGFYFALGYSCEKFNNCV